MNERDLYSHTSLGGGCHVANFYASFESQCLPSAVYSTQETASVKASQRII